MLKKERILHRFFYLEFNLTVLRDPKEEPVEEMTLDLEDRRYNFYLCPLGGGV
jgi:hypothetical protein